MSVRKTRSGKILSDLPIQKRNYKHKRISTESIRKLKTKIMMKFKASNILIIKQFKFMKNKLNHCNLKNCNYKKISNRKNKILKSFNSLCKKKMKH